MNYIIKPEKTAITNGYSKSANYIVSNNIEKNISILDYGAGKLRNANYLNDNGYNVSVLDTKEQINNWNKECKALYTMYSTENVESILEKFDIIICSYVLNVVVDLNDRIDILNNIKRMIKPNGIILIDVRGKKSLKDTKNKESYKDGYIVGKNKIRTFQKEYAKEELTTFLNELGLEIININSNNTNINAICKVK